MATTTNYGWTTPDDTALVKDGASAIRTLGSSVDTTTKALNPSTTLGDIEYRSSTANTNTRLAIGSTGNVLTVAGGVPSWAAPAGGGKMLQVIEGRLTTTFSTSSTSYSDLGLSATITPSSASSRIMVQVYIPAIQMTTTGSNGFPVKLLRGATQVYAVENNAFNVSGSAAAYTAWTFASSIVDSPATTSATTYKIQLRLGNSGTLEANAGPSIATIILTEIGA